MKIRKFPVDKIPSLSRRFRASNPTAVIDAPKEIFRVEFVDGEPSIAQGYGVACGDSAVLSYAPGDVSQLVYTDLLQQRPTTPAAALEDAAATYKKALQQLDAQMKEVSGWLTKVELAQMLESLEEE